MSTEQLPLAEWRSHDHQSFDADIQRSELPWTGLYQSVRSMLLTPPAIDPTTFAISHHPYETPNVDETLITIHRKAAEILSSVTAGSSEICELANLVWQLWLLHKCMDLTTL